jgi:hypothetical protein
VQTTQTQTFCAKMEEPSEQTMGKEARPDQFDKKRLRLDGSATLPNSFQPHAIVEAGDDSFLVGCCSQVSSGMPMWQRTSAKMSDRCETERVVWDFAATWHF